MDAEEDRGEHARMSSFIGAIAIGDLVRSTLGPKGLVSTIILTKKFPCQPVKSFLFRTKYWSLQIRDVVRVYRLLTTGPQY